MRNKIIYIGLSSNNNNENCCWDQRGREVFVFIGLEGLRLNSKQGYLVIGALIPYKKKGEILLSSSIPVVLIIDHKPDSNPVEDTYSINQIKKLLTDELFDSIGADNFSTQEESLSWLDYENKI